MAARVVVPVMVGARPARAGPGVVQRLAVAGVLVDPGRVEVHVDLGHTGHGVEDTVPDPLAEVVGAPERQLGVHADVAVRVLREAGMVPERVREVLVVTLEDEPGALGRYCRRLADAGINLEAVYLAGEKNGSKQLVLAVSDLDTARRL